MALTPLPCAGQGEGENWPCVPLRIILNLQFALHCGVSMPRAVHRTAVRSLPDGLGHPGALHGHRRSVQEVLQGDHPGECACAH